MLTEMGPHSERLQKVGNRGWRGMSSSHPKRCCIILGFRRSPWPQGPLKSAPRERVGFKNQHQHPRTQSQIQGERDKYVAWPFNCVQLSAIPWTVACQSPLPMRFLRQEYWKGLPFPTPGDLPKAGIELRLLHWGGFLTTWASWKAHQGKYDLPNPNIPPYSVYEGRGRGGTIERKSTKANLALPPNALTEKGEEI